MTSLALLAQRSNWERLGDRFSGESAQFRWADLGDVAIVMALAVGFILLLRWLQLRQEKRKNSNQPEHLFADLCAAHRLRRRDRQRMKELASALELEHTAVLFVRPDLFQADSLPEELAEEGQEFDRLAEQLFAGLEEPAEKLSPPTPRVDTPIPVVQLGGLENAILSPTIPHGES